MIRMSHIRFALLIYSIMPYAMAALPVTLTGPSPRVITQIPVGDSHTYLYTIHNNVPGLRAPIRVLGLRSPAVRVTVPNDCGNWLPLGPGSCNIGVLVASSAAHGGVYYTRNLSIDYQDRVPLRDSFEFIVSSQPPIFTVAAGVFPLSGFLASNNPPINTWSTKASNVFYYIDTACTGSGNTATCVASRNDGLILYSNNGAQTFQVANIINRNGVSAQQLSCVSGESGPAYCAATFQDDGDPIFGITSVFTSSDGGATWTHPAGTQTTGAPIDISCSGTVPNQACFALSFITRPPNNPRPFGFYLVPGTNTWSRSNLASPVAAFARGLSCIGSGTNATCIVAGATTSNTPILWVSHNSGVGFTVQRPALNYFFNDVACSGISTGGTCVAVGNSSNVYVSTTLGNTWRNTATVGGLTGVNLTAVSCTGASAGSAVCVAVGTANGQGVILSSRNSGANWTSTLVTNRLTAVACSGTGSTASCVAGGGDTTPYIYISTNGGITWAPQAITGEPGTSRVNAIGSTL